MKTIRKALGIGALLSALVGCSYSKLRDYEYTNFIDLDKDGKQEFVALRDKYGTYNGPHLSATSLNRDLGYSNSEVLMNFTVGSRPNQVTFTDLDGDSDLDLVFVINHDTFVARNRGWNKFDVPRLIDRK